MLNRDGAQEVRCGTGAVLPAIRCQQAHADAMQSCFSLNLRKDEQLHLCK